MALNSGNQSLFSVLNCFVIISCFVEGGAETFRGPKSSLCVGSDAKSDAKFSGNNFQRAEQEREVLRMSVIASLRNADATCQFAMNLWADLYTISRWISSTIFLPSAHSAKKWKWHAVNLKAHLKRTLVCSLVQQTSFNSI